MSYSGPVIFVCHVANSEGGLTLRLTHSPQSDERVVSVDLSQAALDPVSTPRYAEFALVKPFFRHVFKIRPSRVVFDRLCADTADLLRMLVAMAFPVDVVERPDELLHAHLKVSENETSTRWCQGLLALLGTMVDSVTGESPANAALSTNSVGYEEYAFGSRSHSLLILWVERVLRFFEGRGPVLDIGCGTGVFLDQLVRRGIDVRGVDENPASIRYACSLGLNAEVADGLEYLGKHPDFFDAIHCSHLVEHLPFDDLQQFMSKLSSALLPGGRAVFVFPDPESIRSQLLGFWRDPDHVRFYHPDSIELLAASAGLDLEFNSQHEVGRNIVPFPMVPPQSTNVEPAQSLKPDEPLEKLVAQLVAKIDQHEQWIKHLWQVNQTWAWADDAVLVFSKPTL